MPAIPPKPSIPREPRMSPVRRSILNYIKDYQVKFGKTPSIRQLALEFHKSPSTIHFHLQKLVKMGRIRIPRYHRIEVVE